MRAPSAVAPTTFELDVDTCLSLEGAGRYSGELSERWNVGVGMNGGYLAVFCLRAVLAESSLPDPLSMTVRLRQAGRLDFAPSQPLGPGPDESTPVRRFLQPGAHVSLWDRLETRVARPDDVFFLRTEAGQASTGGWTRLADDRPTDALCVPLFLDCGPPPCSPERCGPTPRGHRRRGGTDARAHRPLAQRGTRRMAAGAVQLWPARRWLGGGGRRALVGGRLARRAVEAARATRRQGRGLRPVTLPLPLSPRTPKAMHSAFLAALA